MSVQKDESGNRSVQSEVVVPGTPEEVWKAIASERGISAWFVPTVLDEREGGTVTCHFGLGMETKAQITAWNPPHSFSATSDDVPPGSPPMATEWSVEALSGDTCRVRVVHSLFTDSDEWDDQLEGTESGWPAFFATLRVYCAHFAGQAHSGFRGMSATESSLADTWTAVKKSLGLADKAVGERFAVSGSEGPTCEGTLEYDGPEHSLGMALRLEQPIQAIVSVNAFSMGGPVNVGLGLYVYGPDAQADTEREAPAWQAWLAAVTS